MNFDDIMFCIVIAMFLFVGISGVLNGHLVAGPFCIGMAAFGYMIKDLI